MSTLVLIVLAILAVGPLRRPFLRHARFTVPATICFMLGAGIIGTLAEIVGLSDPIVVLMAMVGGVGLALWIGEKSKDYFDRIFGPVPPPEEDDE